MRISAIVAMSENRAIGKNNQLPWHLPADLKHFKKVTMGQPILMGRKTFQSIGKALPGRCNVVITRDPEFKAHGCVVARNIDIALSSVSYSKEIFVIGGALLFEQMMPKIECIYLTIVHAVVEGDVFFPQLNPNDWSEVSRQKHDEDTTNPFSYTFVTLKRR